MGAYERVWVVGAGAVGSAMAALLELSGRAEVTLVGSSIHWAAVRAGGLIFEIEGAEPITLSLATASTDSLPELGDRDLVLLTGKLTRIEATVDALRDRVSQKVGVIALQNGLGVADLAGRLMRRPVDRGLVYFGAHSPVPGRVRYYAGEIRLRRSAQTEALCAMFSGTSLSCDLIEDLRLAEWSKLAINCLANPLAGLLGVSNARISAPSLNPAKEAILDEIRAVASAEGVSLTLSVDEFNRYSGGSTGGNMASLWIDLARGQPTEIEFLNGAVVEVGRKRGIPTPVNELVVNLIKFLEQSE